MWVRKVSRPLPTPSFMRLLGWCPCMLSPSDTSSSTAARAAGVRRGQGSREEPRGDIRVALWGGLSQCPFRVCHPCERNHDHQIWRSGSGTTPCATRRCTWGDACMVLTANHEMHVVCSHEVRRCYKVTGAAAPSCLLPAPALSHRCPLGYRWGRHMHAWPSCMAFMPTHMLPWHTTLTDMEHSTANEMFWPRAMRTPTLDGRHGRHGTSSA